MHALILVKAKAIWSTYIHKLEKTWWCVHRAEGSFS